MTRLKLKAREAIELQLVRDDEQREIEAAKKVKKDIDRQIQALKVSEEEKADYIRLNEEKVTINFR